MLWTRRVGDSRSKKLAERLMRSASEVREPQRSRIIERLHRTVFISHTSRDQHLIGGPTSGLVLDAVGGVFPDPFLHNIGMGAAAEYEKIVGLALESTQRVLVVWSERALKSDFVRAELFLASLRSKQMIAYIPTRSPPFPVAQATIVRTIAELRVGLAAWKSI